MDPAANPVLFRLRISEFDPVQARHVEKEVFPNLGFTQADPNFVEKLVNGFSDLVTVSVDDYASEDVALLARARDRHFRGRLASADLIDRTDFTSLAGTTMTVTSGSARTVTFTSGNVDATTTLADVADIIQADVRGSATTPATAAFACRVQGGRLGATAWSSSIRRSTRSCAQRRRWRGWACPPPATSPSTIPGSA